MPLWRYLRRPFCSIMLRQNYLPCSPRATYTMRIVMHRKGANLRRQMYMRSAAFIMQYVSHTLIYPGCWEQSVQIFFNTVPFQGKFEYQIMRLVTSGGRPLRLDSPKMENNIWHIIQSCWKNSPSARPTVEEVRTRLVAHGTGRSWSLKLALSFFSLWERLP